MESSYHGIIKLAETMAGYSGLRLETDAYCEVPHTIPSKGVIVMPPLSLDWDEDSDEYIKWWRSLFHECFHNNRKTDAHKCVMEAGSLVERKLRPKKWMFLHNLVEDVRMEANEYGVYEGRDRIMRKGYVWHWTNFKKKMLDAEGKKRNPVMEAAFIWFHSAYGRVYMEGKNDPFSFVTPESEEMALELEKYTDTVVGGIDWKACIEIADEFYKILYKEDPEHVEEEEEEGEKGEAEEDYLPKSEEEAEDKEGEGRGVINYKEWMEHDHSPEEGESAYGKEVSLKVDYSGSWRGRPYPGVPMKEIESANLPKADSGTLYTNLIIAKANLGGLANQIKKMLLVSTRTKTAYAQKSGNIDQNSLWKAVAYRGKPAGERVFKKKEDRLTLDTAVTLLVDQSGSMAMAKFCAAASSALVLNEVFAKLGVKVRVSGFTDTSSTTYSFTHKGFAERISKEDLAQRMVNAAAYTMEGNADGENIDLEYYYLKRRPEPRKILIVLSDGQPADSKWLYDTYGYTKQVVSKIEKEGIVEIIGIGILDDTVKDIYTKNVVLLNTEDIEAALLNLLKTKVIHA